MKKLLCLFVVFAIADAYLLDFHLKHKMFKYQNSVYKVLGVSHSSATAFRVQYKNKTYLMTNAHVCQSNVEGTLKISNIVTEIAIAKIIMYDVPADLCILTDPITNEYSTPFNIDRSTTKPLLVYYIGYPLGILASDWGFAIKEEMIPMSIISEQILTPAQLAYDYEQCFSLGGDYFPELTGNLFTCNVIRTETLTTMKANFGASGSPILDNDGNLVGVLNITSKICDKIAGSTLCLLSEKNTGFIDKEQIIFFMEDYLDLLEKVEKIINE